MTRTKPVWVRGLPGTFLHLVGLMLALALMPCLALNLRLPGPLMQMPGTGTASKRLLVIGGNGFVRQRPARPRPHRVAPQRDLRTCYLLRVQVGREVCKNAVQQGYAVTSLSRRGECPLPGDEFLSQVLASCARCASLTPLTPPDVRRQVEWTAGDALDKSTIDTAVGKADAVVHCIGLLFDANSGLTFLNTFTSASGSKPTDESTYDSEPAAQPQRSPHC